jgi:serine phosphatase RsbU (regulator of sigma subunit)
MQVICIQVVDGPHTAIANAGHLSPYLDGQEIDLPGALPLGIMSGATYDATQFQLASGTLLTFYSDCVVEAKNEKNSLASGEEGRSPPNTRLQSSRLQRRSDRKMTSPW